MRRPRPPSRDGVAASVVWVPAGHWASVLDFLAERLPAVPRAGWATRLAAGEVLDASGQPLTDAPLTGPCHLHYFRAVDGEPDPPEAEDILFQDDHLLVIDKPAFMPVMPTGRFVQQSLLVRLRRRTGIDDLAPLHRLDRETAGLVLFSLNPASRGRYVALFRERTITKVYEAIAPLPPAGLGFPLRRQSRLERDDARFFLQHEVPGEPNATVDIDCLQRGPRHALYRLQPETGRLHQLRVQLLGLLGGPIVNDQFYPVPRPSGDDDFTRPLQLLARSLAFNDPLTGQPRSFTSRRALDLSLLRAETRPAP